MSRQMHAGCGFLAALVMLIPYSPIKAEDAKYSAKQNGTNVTVYAEGFNPTSGWTNKLEWLPNDVYPPEFKFSQTKPSGVAAEMKSPFMAQAIALAPTTIDHVFVIDTSGKHEVSVDQTSAADAFGELHSIPADAKAILENADDFELLSLNPNHLNVKPKEDFHGYEVLGKKAIAKADCKQLVDAFEQAVAEKKTLPAHCFIPRHGIRVTRGNESADFVICFQCHQVRGYVTGQKESWFLVSSAPAALFNKVLRGGGAKLAEE
ncbi:MAG: hypothetical protein ACLQU5_22485 [Isosphaeraceae bacterium]